VVFSHTHRQCDAIETMLSSASAWRHSPLKNNRNETVTLFSAYIRVLKYKP